MTTGPWSAGAGPTASPRPASGRQGADPIATSLQQLFAPLASEPIPDEFLALLDQIDAKARAIDAAGNTKGAGAGAVE